MAKEHGFKNVESKKEDIENNIPIEDDSVELRLVTVLSTWQQIKWRLSKKFTEYWRKMAGRMIVSDLVTSKEVHGESVSVDNWCNCIDRTLTKEHYINSMIEGRISRSEDSEWTTVYGCR